VLKRRKRRKRRNRHKRASHKHISRHRVQPRHPFLFMLEGISEGISGAKPRTRAKAAQGLYFYRHGIGTLTR
jgi:hypothetical protein